MNDFQIAKLLLTDDLGQDADAGSGIPPANPVQHVPALINCKMIDESGAKLAAIGTSPGTTLGYFAAPFRAAVTLANLRGIPYQVRGIPSIMDFTGAAFVQHDDFAWFAFPNGASPAPTATSIGKREDEFWLDDGNAGAGFAGYNVLVAYATASAAMPLGLAARALVRPAEHYHYRPQVHALPEAPGFKVRWPDPGWTHLTATNESGIYTLTSVDGGTFNNNPVALVHTALAGTIGRNPPDSSSATRAMFMIDPLADKPQPIGNVGKSLYLGRQEHHPDLHRRKPLPDGRHGAVRRRRRVQPLPARALPAAIGRRTRQGRRAGACGHVAVRRGGLVLPRLPRPRFPAGPPQHAGLPAA